MYQWQGCRGAGLRQNRLRCRRILPRRARHNRAGAELNILQNHVLFDSATRHVIHVFPITSPARDIEESSLFTIVKRKDRCHALPKHKQNVNNSAQLEWNHRKPAQYVRFSTHGSSSSFAWSNEQADQSCKFQPKQSLYVHASCCVVNGLAVAWSCFAKLQRALRRIADGSRWARTRVALQTILGYPSETLNCLFDGWKMLVSNCTCEILTAESSENWSARSSKSSQLFGAFQTSWKVLFHTYSC